MEILRAIILGAIQGVTEVLPISSSAHLILAPAILGWSDPGLAFDVALHLGTLLALLLFFYRDWLGIIGAGLGFGGGFPRKTLWLLLLGALPGAAAGVLFEGAAKGSLRTLPVIAVALIFGGALLLAADRWGKKIRAVESLRAVDVLAVGLAQALAIVPGFSRSGMTIAALRYLGFDREKAARVSFLFAAPIVAGAAIFSLRDLRAADISAAFLLGIASAFLSGLVAIRILLAYVSRADYKIFVWYRWALAVAILALLLYTR